MKWDILLNLRTRFILYKFRRFFSIIPSFSAFKMTLYIISRGKKNNPHKKSYRQSYHPSATESKRWRVCLLGKACEQISTAKFYFILSGRGFETWVDNAPYLAKRDICRDVEIVKSFAVLWNLLHIILKKWVNVYQLNVF